MSYELDPLEQQISEACDSLWNAVVDPREAYWDDEGQWWDALTSVAGRPDGAPSPCLDERQLVEARLQCRRLALTNEFAINGHENRVSYLIGPGHSYRAIVRKGAAAASELAAEVQQVLDEFLAVNNWQGRQQEIVRRLDRDGEAFLRFFVAADGVTRVRFIEPEQVATPPELARTPWASF
ncbi:MAG TPA: hypothetical protein VEQ85_08020, partial [Lacipirellulaceae bacterium]|nr:hypothetical protein [Lacipirellulaceae bacterium]